ncbi:MAG: DUF6868 family protein [Cycloclasticus sp.]|nr:hypothetical protein [Cycloclasticus sp.]HIL91509.1 hypothetical protein [Cycloclasticus sp.]
MTDELIQTFLGWCFVVNYAVLFLWFLYFTLGHDWLYNFHSRWFKLSVERFDSANYLCMGFYKLSIILFNLAPYLVLKYLV